MVVIVAVNLENSAPCPVAEHEALQDSSQLNGLPFARSRKAIPLSLVRSCGFPLILDLSGIDLPLVVLICSKASPENLMPHKSLLCSLKRSVSQSPRPRNVRVPEMV